MLIEVTLSGFVKRTLNTDALKVAIKSTGAKLTRKGRSRNWVLQADTEQVHQIIDLTSDAGEDSWLWLTKKLAENKHPLSHEELLELARQNPKITVTHLMSVTDCTLVEARKVLDQLEWE